MNKVFADEVVLVGHQGGLGAARVHDDELAAAKEVCVQGLIGPFYALVFPNPRRAVWLLCAWLGTVALEALLIGHVPWAQPLSLNLNLVSFLAVVCIFSLFVMATLFYFIHERSRAFRLLDEERHRSENLLLNILPREIASILKGGNRVSLIAMPPSASSSPT